LEGPAKKKTNKIEAAIDKYCARKDIHQKEKKLVGNGDTTTSSSSRVDVSW